MSALVHIGMNIRDCVLEQLKHPESWVFLNPLTAGVAYIRVFIFYQHIKYHLLNMFKIIYDINQQDLKTVDLHFVKSE